MKGDSFFRFDWDSTVITELAAIGLIIVVGLITCSTVVPVSLGTSWIAMTKRKRGKQSMDCRGKKIFK